MSLRNSSLAAKCVWKMAPKVPRIANFVLMEVLFRWPAAARAGIAVIAS